MVCGLGFAWVYESGCAWAFVCVLVCVLPWGCSACGLGFASWLACGLRSEF